RHFENSGHECCRYIHSNRITSGIQGSDQKLLVLFPTATSKITGANGTFISSEPTKTLVPDILEYLPSWVDNTEYWNPVVTSACGVGYEDTSCLCPTKIHQSVYFPGIPAKET